MHQQPQRVTLFIQCLVDTMFPEVGWAMVSVLEKLGLQLDYPAQQTCCGQPAYNSGYKKDARGAASHFLKTFAGAEAIVCPSGSCVHMVRHHYLELFADDPAQLQLARDLAARTYEFSEFLVDRLGITQLDATFPGSFTYHDSCHLARGLGIRKQPRQLLEQVAGLQLVEMAGSDTCCGFGGTFAIKYPEISTSMADDKIDAILATGADGVIGCDVSCLMNIKGRARRLDKNFQVLHLAEVLAGRRATS